MITGRAHCLYCGYTGERRPFEEAKAETLEHGRTCESHPMRDLLAACEMVIAFDDAARAIRENVPEPRFLPMIRAAVAKAKGQP